MLVSWHLLFLKSIVYKEFAFARPLPVIFHAKIQAGYNSLMGLMNDFSIRLNHLGMGKVIVAKLRFLNLFPPEIL